MLNTTHITYFAYGSCMNRKDFLRTSPNAIFMGAANLSDYYLDFTSYSYIRGGGVADILQLDGSTVEGVVWLIPIDEAHKLDAREGAPYVYKRQSVNITLQGDTLPISAITYTVLDKENPSRPNDTYLDLIVSGGESAGLSDGYLLDLINYSESLPKGDSRWKYSEPAVSFIPSAPATGSYQWGEEIVADLVNDTLDIPMFKL